MIETNSPGLMSIAIRRARNVCPAPTGNDFSTPLSDISGAVGSIWGGSVRAEEERLKIMSCSLCEPGRDQYPCRTVLRNLRDLGVYLFDGGNRRPVGGQADETPNLPKRQLPNPQNAHPHDLN